VRVQSRRTLKTTYQVTTRN